MDNLDQLSSLLSPILNNPEAMAGIAQAASQLGLGDLLGSAVSENEDRASAASEPSDNGNAAESSQQNRDIGDMLGQILPLLTGAGGTPDDSTRLLSALRPFLHGDRAKRLGDAERIVKMVSIINTMRQQGLL